jgi:DNA-binding response OmpR family regulator
MPRIIIIDDDPQIRLMLRMTLEKAGYTVEEAANGKEGLCKHNREPAELIITDLIMPEQEGMETIAELRRDSPATKIIAISGGGFLAPKNYLALAKEIGASCTLSKPIPQDSFLSAVRGLIGCPKQD